ncbi:MAG TPA: 4-hydroxy-3-methylbut-2-en-1-yl diphosphate synthase, partial [Firmicutes bacterium]|nr:4-hydroxy-3-methylbut-2-en-1-yl diphosphate synthase [Bacillota bacterium]
MKRTETKPIFIAGLQLGGLNRVLIQSMSSIKTSKIEQVITQINELTDLG